MNTTTTNHLKYRENLRSQLGLRSMKTFVILLACINFPCYAHVASLTEEQIQDLEDLVKNVMHCREVPGMSVAVVRHDETVYTGGFGYKEFKNKDPVTETTLFNIASESKAFTTAVAADAVGRGKLTWDAPIREVLGNKFRLQDDFRTENANIKDFLSHKLGIPGYWGIATSVMNLTKREILERTKNFPELYDFRRRYRYSNFLYTMAAAVVEIASCETWEDAVYNRIFKPLGMTGSRVSKRLSDADWDNMAYSHAVVDGKFIQYDEKGRLPIVKELAAAAGVYSNAVDIAKWMRFHLNDGKNEAGQQVVDTDALKETHRSQTSQYVASLTRPEFPVDDMIFAYAMGWRYGVYNGYRKLFHTAAYSAYQGTLTLLPDAKIGVWTYISGAANGKGSDARKTVTMYALDMLLGRKPWINSTTACSFPAPWATPKPPRIPVPVPTEASPTLSPAINTSLYVGVYHHPAFGSLEILHDDQHMFAYRYGELMRGYLVPRNNYVDFFQIMTGPLSILHYDYVHRWPRGYLPVTFHREGESVTGVQFHYFDFSVPPLFERQKVHTDYNTISKNWCEKPTTTTSGTTSTATRTHLSRLSCCVVVLLVVIFRCSHQIQM